MSDTKKKKGRRTKAEIEATNELFAFIYKEYNVSSLPKYIFTNISKLFKGEYSKRVIEPISVFDLYDMWQRKMDFLNETYEYNKTHGKDMYGAQRISYDLAILINKYDSYKRWKEKQEAMHEQEKSYVQQQAKMRVVKPKIQVSEDDDISNIIDEI